MAGKRLPMSIRFLVALLELHFAHKYLLFFLNYHNPVAISLFLRNYFMSFCFYRSWYIIDWFTVIEKDL